MFSLLLNVYVIPFVTFYYFSLRVYNRLQVLVTTYYTKYTSPAKEENLTQITPSAESKTPKSQSLIFTIAAAVVVDRNGAPTGVDYHTALATFKAASELNESLTNQVASAAALFENLICVEDVLRFIAIFLALRTCQLLFR